MRMTERVWEKRRGCGPHGVHVFQVLLSGARRCICCSLNLRLQLHALLLQRLPPPPPFLIDLLHLRPPLLPQELHLARRQRAGVPSALPRSDRCLQLLHASESMRQLLLELTAGSGITLRRRQQLQQLSLARLPPRHATASRPLRCASPPYLQNLNFSCGVGG
jgi:hypothetical protein